MKPGFEDMAKTFEEESNDLLILMEESLLDIQENGFNENSINAVFRAAHTIKGSGGLFELEYLVKFTHSVENLLDKIRNYEVDLNEDILEILFKSKDQMQSLVDFAINSEEDNPNEDIIDISTNLLSEISLCLENKDDNQNKTNKKEDVKDIEEDSIDDKDIEEDSIDDKIAKMIQANAKKRKKLNKKIYEIELSFHNEAFLNGMEPLEFINELNNEGKVTKITSDTSEIPELQKLNINESFINFNIIYESSKNIKDVEDIFILGKDFCNTLIKEVNSDDTDTSKVDSDDTDTSEVNSNDTDTEEVNSDDTDTEEVNSDDMESLSTTSSNIKELSTPTKETKTNAIKKDSLKKSQNIPSQVPIRTSSTLKVDSQKIDNLINLIGEMVIANSNVVEQVSKDGNKELIESVSVLSRMLEEMREASMQTRMVPIGDTFNRFKRTVRDLSRDLNKDIELQIIGAETELDKTVVEKISDPLMHLVRNSIDHGIETSKDRIEKNKNPKGTLVLKAYHEAGSIVIEINDDGKGLDPEALFAKALEKGLVSEGDDLSTNEKLSLIMKAGFSTAEKITNVSGRGVGMDVVKKNIEELRGIIELKSEIDKGTTILIRLPLTLAIIEGFLTKVANKHFIIPLEMVVECIELKEKYKTEFKENRFINLRGHILSVLDLRDFFKIKKTKSKRENIVIIKFANIHIGLIVNELEGEFQTVIKPLGKIFRNTIGIGGATILGSGEVALILDVPMLIQNLNSIKEKNKGEI